MASLLSIKDNFQTWVDKVNAILTLNTADGNFRIEEVDNLYITISAGKVRKITDVITINSQAFTLLPNSTIIIGLDTVNDTIEQHEVSVLPTNDFIPLWKFVTTTLIIDSIDLRTWVIA